MASERVRWMDFEPSWMEEPWSWTHTVGCAFATFLYVVPGVIFLTWKLIAGASYNKKELQVKEAQDAFFRYTQCDTLASITHLGSHPKLPLNTKILMGTKGHMLCFYTYDASLLLSVPIAQVEFTEDIRKITTSSFGSTYTPKGSRIGTSSTTHTLEFKPDSLKLLIPMGEQVVTALFDTNKYDPRALVQWLHEVKSK